MEQKETLDAWEKRGRLDKVRILKEKLTRGEREKTERERKKEVAEWKRKSWKYPQNKSNNSMLQDNPPRPNQQGEPAMATTNHTQTGDTNQSLQYLKKYALILSPALLMTSTNSEKPATTSKHVQIPTGSTLASIQHPPPDPNDGSSQQQVMSSTQPPTSAPSLPHVDISKQQQEMVTFDTKNVGPVSPLKQKFSEATGSTLQEDLDSAQYPKSIPSGSSQQQKQNSAQYPSSGPDIPNPKSPHISTTSAGKYKTGFLTSSTGKFGAGFFTSRTGKFDTSVSTNSAGNSGRRTAKPPPPPPQLQSSKASTQSAAGYLERKRWTELGKDLDGKMRMWEVIDIGIKKSTRSKEQFSKVSRIKNNEQGVQKIQSLGKTKNTVEVLNVDGKKGQGNTFPSNCWKLKKFQMSILTDN